MIHFPLLRTRRLTAQLRELSIGQSIAIAAMPAHLMEAECTAFLRAAVQSAQGVEDPADWTVQERMLGVAHYLASTADDGPDFALGEGRYSDYLDAASDIRDHGQAVDVGEVDGDAWRMHHLTGRMAESIERVGDEVQDASGAPLPGRLRWLLGAMAAQMTRVGEVVPAPQAGEGAFDEFLVQRMRVLSSFPESSFAVLMALFQTGRRRLHHLFDIEFASDGLVAMPKGGGAVDLPPARFPVRAGLSPLAFDLVGKPGRTGH